MYLDHIHHTLPFHFFLGISNTTPSISVSVFSWNKIHIVPSVCLGMCHWPVGSSTYQWPRPWCKGALPLSAAINYQRLLSLQGSTGSHFLIYTESLASLVLHRSGVSHHSGFESYVQQPCHGQRKALFPSLWLWHSFCPLFPNCSWTLGLKWLI